MKSISVIICTYNSDIKKLLLTILSVVNQKNIDFEIIISDDASMCTHVAELKILFDQYKFSDYKINLLQENKGIVKNLLSGMEKSSGEYIYAISPGDYLFDENTLYDFYCFAKKSCSDCVIGKVINYSFTDGSTYVKLQERDARPVRPGIYSKCVPQIFQKSALLRESYIYGVAFFRKRSYAFDCIGAIRNYSIFTEDITSASYGAINGKRIDWLNKYIAWYECGVGVSTTGKMYVHNDIANVFKFLRTQFIDDPIWRFVDIDSDLSLNHFSKLISKIRNSPKYLIIQILTGFFPCKKTPVDQVLSQKLQRFISEAEIKVGDILK